MTAVAQGHQPKQLGQQTASVDYDVIIQQGAPPGGDRSAYFQGSVRYLAGKGLSVDETRPLGKGGCAVVFEPRRICAGGVARDCYQRAGVVIRPILDDALTAAHDQRTEAWRLLEVTGPHLTETLMRAAKFLRYDQRTRKLVHANCAGRVAETYLHRRGEWKLKTLVGIVTTPVLRRDGSILQQPGYDDHSGLLFKPGSTLFPPVPVSPTRDDALKALEALKGIVGTFPFVEASESVALSGILTAMDRHAMSTAPLHGFMAPTAGTGKSLLVDLISIIVNGAKMPVTSKFMPIPAFSSLPEPSHFARRCWVFGHFHRFRPPVPSHPIPVNRGALLFRCCFENPVCSPPIIGGHHAA